MICCFCGQPTDADDAGPYVHLVVTMPDVDNEGSQHLGAHGGCLSTVVRGVPLIGDLEHQPLDQALNGRLILGVERYVRSRGVVADVEGGSVTIENVGDEVAISGDAAGLRDLARWCLAVSDETAPPYSHVHLDDGVIPLASSSPMTLLISRVETLDFGGDETAP